ncbi:hypothetical protein [Desulforhopalus sp. 52FAK]
MFDKDIYTFFLVPTISLFLLSSYAIAEPEISSISGKVSEGQTIKIFGSSLGTKSPAAPILWDNFNGGTDGGRLDVDPNWTMRYDSPLYTSTQPYGGSGLAIYNEASYGDSDMLKFRSASHSFTGVKELYYSYMNRHVGASTSGRVYKNGRIGADGERYSGPGVSGISDGYFLFNSGSGFIYPTASQGYNPDYRFESVDVGSANWQRHQLYSKASSPAGTANGRVYAAVHTQRKDYPNIVSMKSGYDFDYDIVLLGTMMDQPGVGETHYMYIDDVYIDNTLARVELCTSETWDYGASCNPQIPTAWSDNSVTVTVNQGAFASYEYAYLYVVDSEGNVNNNGLQIIVNESYTDGGNPPADVDIPVGFQMVQPN